MAQILDSTSESIVIQRGESDDTNGVDWTAAWINKSSSAVTPGGASGRTSNTTEATVLASPAASEQRELVCLTVFNGDTAAATITCSFKDSSNLRPIWKRTIPIGRTVVITADGQVMEYPGTASAGDVSGPASSTDNAIARFDGAGGTQIQNSGVTISDTDAVDGALSFTVDDNGSAGSPAFALPMGTGAGLFQEDAATIGISAGGVSWVSLNATGILIANTSAFFIDGTLTLDDTGGSGHVLKQSSAGGSVTSGQVTLTSDVSGILPMANGGTGANLSDPNRNAFFVWDDTAGANKYAQNYSEIEIGAGTIDYSHRGGKTLESLAEFGSATSSGWDGLGRQLSGTGASVSSGTVTGSRVGVQTFTTGTSTTGRAHVAESSGLITGNGEIVLEAVITDIPTLSDGTNTFYILMGLVQVITSATANNRICFRYSHGLNGGEWVGETDNAGATTTVDSNVVVATSTEYKLRIVINAVANSVEFFVNGTSIGTSSTNIPAMELVVNFGIFKTAGMTARTFDADRIYRRYIRTTEV